MGEALSSQQDASNWDPSNIQHNKFTCDYMYIDSLGPYSWNWVFNKSFVLKCRSFLASKLKLIKKTKDPVLSTNTQTYTYTYSLRNSYTTQNQRKLMVSNCFCNPLVCLLAVPVLIGILEKYYEETW